MAILKSFFEESESLRLKISTYNDIDAAYAMLEQTIGFKFRCKNEIFCWIFK